MLFRLLTFESIKKKDQISSLWFVVLLICCISVFCLCHLKFNDLPTPNLSEDDQTLDFNARRAREYLTKLTSLGPKVAGSFNNEVLARLLLLSELEIIQKAKNPIHAIDISTQTADGNLYLDYNVNGMSATYQGVQNVVVRLRDANVTNPENNLLINSHYDTVAVSPGGGDAGTMISVMLETLRVLSLNEKPFEHGIVFLFNGCEENALQGAHAFITQHEWASRVQAVLNLDAAGNGGREIMFQASPGHSWLMNYYRKHAPHPYTSAMGEELFQAEFIPSDTDFRIFRDYGDVPGMDFAFNTNGYVYHTKHDTGEIVPDGTLQHTGDNLLALVKVLADCEELRNTTGFTDEKVVFFDFMNMFMIYYTETEAKWVNLIIIIAAVLLSIGLCYVDYRNNNKQIHFKLKNMWLIMAQFWSLLFGIAFVVLLSWFYDAIDFSMRWYHSSYLIFGMYFCPLYFWMSFGPTLYLKFYPKLSPAEAIEAMMMFHCEVLIVILIALVILEIRTAFMIMVPIFLYALSLIVQLVLKFYRTRFVWRLITHLVFQVMPFCFYSTWTVIAFATFIPISGRSGVRDNPELMIAIFSIGMALLLAGFLIPLIPIFKSPVGVSLSFFVMWFISFIVLLTPAGFPYAKDVAPQRQSAHHILRSFYDIDGTVRREDSGYFVRGHDRNNELIWDYAKNPEKDTYFSTYDECLTEFYCGLPLLYNTQFDSVLFIHAEPPVIPYARVVLSLQGVTSDTQRVKLDFKLTCPNNCGLYISPSRTAQLVNWTFSDTIPPSNQYSDRRPVYFVSYFNVNLQPQRPDLDFSVTLDLQGQITSGRFLTIGIAGHYTAHLDQFSEGYKEFLDQFPPWTAVDNWISTWSSHEFGVNSPINN